METIGNNLNTLNPKPKMAVGFYAIFAPLEFLGERLWVCSGFRSFGFMGLGASWVRVRGEVWGFRAVGGLGPV